MANHRRVLLAFTFSLICSITPTTSFSAGDTCEHIFRSSSLPVEISENLVAKLTATPEARYVITRLNDDIPVIATFAGSETQNGVFYIRFKIENRDETILVNPITAALNKAPAQLSYADDPVKMLKANLAMVNDLTRDISRIMYEPRPRVFNANGVEIFGNFGSLKHRDSGQLIGRVLTTFDDFLKSAGFRTPAKTIIHIRDTQYAKKIMMGPYCINEGLWSPWRGYSDNTISLLPYQGESTIVTSPSVIMHERVHSMLAITYRPDAFFNRPTAQSLQEAIPDFLAAHFSGNPVIAGEISQHRDLTRVLTGARGGFPVTRNIFRTDQFMSQYHNSLAYSGILWRIREAIGADRMTSDLKGLLDALAQTGGPYTGFISSTPLEIEHGNMQHFLRTLSRFYKNDGVAMKVIDAAADANFFTLDGLGPTRMGAPGASGSGLATADQRPNVGISKMVYSTARVALPPTMLGTIIYFVLLQDDQN